jgi:formylglycine-generating enzyme required for sulfatase activity
VLVSWYDAVAFCEWAGLELPTEEQWEKAARGTDGRIYPWGNNQPTDKLCNFNQNVGGTIPMGQYSPQGDSPYGCVDMSGNVWEWCLNKYKTPEVTTIDQSGNWRVLRGGAWDLSQDLVRAAVRDDGLPANRYDGYGFRVVAVRPPSQ